MAFRFQELTREQGYATSDSSEDGAARVVYQLQGVDDNTPPLVKELAGFSSFLCGGVNNIEPKVTEHTDPDAGKVRRRLPKCHPFKRELSVAGVTNITGAGLGIAANSLQGLGVEAATEQFWHYQAYDYTTEFRRRPYFLVPDEFIDRPKKVYTKPDGTDVDVYVAQEYRRYTTTSLQPTPDTVNATTGGQMRFRSPAVIDGAQYPGNVWIYMENQVLEVNWFLVPYRYFFKHGTAKPYLTRFVNTVNQHEMMGNAPGTMLFLGATPTPYQPQSTEVIELFDLGLFQSQSLLCNVKLRWLVTSRESTDLPAAGTAGLANKNNIAAGHNLMPNFVDRKFYYVTTEDVAAPADTTKWRASFPSFPHELFFTDPMLTQPGGPI